MIKKMTTTIENEKLISFEWFDKVQNRKEYAERFLKEIQCFRRLLKSDIIPNHEQNSINLEKSLKQYIKYH